MNVREVQHWLLTVQARTNSPRMADALALRTEVPAMAAALQAVLDLHRPVNGPDSPNCGHCLHEDAGALLMDWPCPTVVEIMEALG